MSLTIRPVLALGLIPPPVALVVTLLFIVFLFRRDFRQRPNVTSALWLPLIWMFLVASKPVSKWLNIIGVSGFVATSVEEGSSLDALVFLALIASAIYVLCKRQVRLSEAIRRNACLTIFILYCFAAIFWSDYPLVSLKRWVKVLGHPLMVLVLLTEPGGKEALITLVKRCAFVVLPISILWIKYYPTLGRTASEWGMLTNCGTATSKNALGGICCILTLFFVWYLFQVLRTEKGVWRRNELRLTAFLILMALYCLGKAHSATSDISLLLGLATVAVLSMHFIDRRTIGVYVLSGILLVAIAQIFFDIYGQIVDLTGHESTIEGRGRLWEVLLAMDKDPILGVGFESFWLGARPDDIWSSKEFWWHPTQAHNGYLELYLNLGAVGLVLLAAMVLVTFRKIRGELLSSHDWGRFEMGCLAAILVHNWTEAGFRGLSFPFLVFFIIAINYSPSQNNGFVWDGENYIPEELEVAYSESKTDCR